MELEQVNGVRSVYVKHFCSTVKKTIKEKPEQDYLINTKFNRHDGCKISFKFPEVHRRRLLYLFLSSINTYSPHAIALISPYRCKMPVFFFFLSALPLFGDLYHHLPVSWNSSSCSLFSSLIAAMTGLNAPFKRFPSTMWSGSALSLTPYLSLFVDNVTWRTFSSYINTPWEKKKEAEEQPFLTTARKEGKKGWTTAPGKA